MRNTLILVALAVVAVVSGIASRTPAPDPRPAPSATTQPLGHYVRGARFVGTDDQGRVAYRVFAERLDELPSDGQFSFTGITIEYTPTDETSWRISAANGRAPKDSSRFELMGNVELTSAPTDGAAPRQLTAESLEFWPQSSRVESVELVRMQLGDWYVEGQGLRADLKADTLRLESKGHGRFAP